MDAVFTAVLGAIALVTLAHFLPGDPLEAVIGDRQFDAATVAAMRARWGVDRTLLDALRDTFGGLARGDLVSWSAQRPVTELVLERIGPTLLLGGLTLLIDFTVGLGLGVWAALHPTTLRSRFLGAFTITGYALPSFAVGLVLVWLFAVQLAWLPAGSMTDPLLPADASAVARLVDYLRHLALPLATMVIATFAVPFRHQRSAVVGTAAAPWVAAARARGVSPSAVAWRHCWRPALTPIVTLFGLWLPILVSGAVFIEVVFAWPGLGTLIADATARRDVPLVVASGMLVIVAVQVGSLVADVLYRVVDPAQRTA